MPAYWNFGFEEGWSFIVSWFRMSVLVFWHLYNHIDTSIYVYTRTHLHTHIYTYIYVCKILTNPKGKVVGTISSQTKANQGILPWVGIGVIFRSCSLLCHSEHILILLATRSLTSVCWGDVKLFYRVFTHPFCAALMCPIIFDENSVILHLHLQWTPEIIRCNFLAGWQCRFQ